jgi:hypothetical protein
MQLLRSKKGGVASVIELLADPDKRGTAIKRLAYLQPRIHDDDLDLDKGAEELRTQVMLALIVKGTTTRLTLVTDQTKMDVVVAFLGKDDVAVGRKGVVELLRSRCESLSDLIKLLADSTKRGKVILRLAQLMTSEGKTPDLAEGEAELRRLVKLSSKHKGVMAKLKGLTTTHAL